jgi:hypothetical protein
MSWTEMLMVLSVGYVFGIINFVLFIRFIRNSRIISKTKLEYYKELES